MAARGRQNAAEDQTARDLLFRAAPSEFVPLRNRLAKEAAQKGDKQQAEFLRKLPKPSVAVWAINQVARDEPEAIRALLESADRVKQEQAKALRGSGGSAEELRAASAELRKRLAAVVKAAADALARAGHEPSSTVLRRVETTLNSIAIGSDSECDALQSGQLTREVEQFGFPMLGGAMPQPSQAREERSAHGKRDERNRHRDPAREERARSAARRKEIARAAAALEQARRSARALSASAGKASSQAHRMAKRADDAERLAAARRHEATAAEQRAAELKRQAEEAAQKLAQAQQNVLTLKAAARSDS